MTDYCRKLFPNKRVILASASPRRHSLLRLIFSEFDIVPSDTDETLPVGLSPEQIAMTLARRKAEAVDDTQSLIIGCDTIVVCENLILGKPENEADAKRMLRLLSGKTHRVISGVCLLEGLQQHSFYDVTEVTFLPLTDDELNGYVESGEPSGKAGAYAIQGGGGLFVKSIRGDYANVVGLPVSKLYHELLRFTS